MYKSSVGDFPLKDYPCEHWWVGYAVACTYIQKQFQKIWDVRLEELKEKHQIISFSSRGFFNSLRIRNEKSANIFLKSKIFVRFSDGSASREEEVNAKTHPEIYNVIREYLAQLEMIGWTHCPFEKDKQSKCPFYSPSEFYKKVSLKELRKRQGYEV